MIASLRKYWLIISLVLFLALPLASFLIGSVVLFAYIHWPNHYHSIDFSQYTSAKAHVVILAHGVKDDTRSWVEPLQTVYQNNSYDGEVMSVDWSQYANNTLRCAIEGKRIGQLIGESILNSEEIRSVHLIGHSCGSFVVYGACLAIKKQRPEIIIQSSYLDPVSIYGPDWNYGVDRFGRCADYSEAYIDTEDGVPGSNRLLPNTHTYDVTAVRKRTNNGANPHNWPTVYYRQLVEAGLAPEYHRNKSLLDNKAAGVLELVE